jgi:hypothetical protein
MKWKALACIIQIANEKQFSLDLETLLDCCMADATKTDEMSLTEILTCMKHLWQSETCSEELVR